MSFDISKTPPYVLPGQRSDYEQTLAPDRGELITANAVEFPSNAAQQGPVATTANYKTDYSGSGPGGVAGYRWF